MTLDRLPAPPTPTPYIASLRLDAFTYDDRALVLPALAEALDHTGCWVLERRAVSRTQLELRLELEIRAVADLYGSLLGTGLELTRPSHLALTSLCIVRQHRRRRSEPFRTVEARLGVTFLEELDLASALLPAVAAA